MRYYRKTEILLSEDTANDPKQVRFSSEEADTELTILKDGGGNSKDYPIGTHAVDISEITEGRWFYIKANQAITISINGGAALTLVANKATEAWMKFTSLSFTTTAITRVTVAVAGE